eukprot:957070-Prorocentrum_minimum.AAC.2
MSVSSPSFLRDGRNAAGRGADLYARGHLGATGGDACDSDPAEVIEVAGRSQLCLEARAEGCVEARVCACVPDETGPRQMTSKVCQEGVLPSKAVISRSAKVITERGQEGVRRGSYRQRR